MPFTPFHLGPGALCKAIGGKRFSFLIFGGSQVLMDVEPLVRMIRGDAVLHGVTHTVVGALVIALLSTAVGRPISSLALRISGLSDHPISWGVALLSALIGTYSHVAFDAVMHGDMESFWPLTQGNAFLGSFPVETLHLVCILAGLLGAGLVALRSSRKIKPD